MAKVSEIGQMDTLVELRSCVITSGAQGEVVYNFTSFRRVWAKVQRDVSEMVDDYNLEGSRSYLLTIYKVPTLTTCWRVIMASQEYEITNIVDDERLSPLMTLSIHAIDGITNG